MDRFFDEDGRVIHNRVVDPILESIIFKFLHLLLDGVRSRQSVGTRQLEHGDGNAWLTIQRTAHVIVSRTELCSSDIAQTNELCSIPLDHNFVELLWL